MDFIDIHNHIAWNIDDGIASKEDTMIALENARKDGITTLIATPHYFAEIENEKRAILLEKRLQELKQLALRYHIDVKFGSEVFLNQAFLDIMHKNQFYTLAKSKYLLVEFDVRKNMNNDDEAEDYLYELLDKGYTPIIAHVERYFPSGIDLERVRDWINSGCYVQVNRTSILGAHGEVCKKNAYLLLEHGLVHIVASDAHRCEGHRVLKLSDAFHKIEKKFGHSNAVLLCKRNPNQILLGQDLDDMIITQKKSFLWSWIKRKGK